ncbi:DUF998 domain-containing protein [Streptomyces sp. NPDC090025]|uniref:DUF998 domain-containing protein n=1 Tax=Streptomyces sp. NPDC090025 TaxID=3365922 RepID=UPI003837AD8A
MTATLSTPRLATAPRTAPRRALVAGTVAGPLFLATGLVQGLSREGFGFGRNAISQLALGDLGWIQTISFLVTGALLLAGAAGLRRVLRGERGGTWAPALVGVFGASFWAAAAFDADAGAGFPVGAPDAATMTGHGAAHMAAGMIGYLSLCVALLLLARPLAARGDRAFARATRIAPVFVLAGFMASAASVMAFTAGAALGLLWLSAVLYRLNRPGAAV